jgi:hypothetical protein
MENFTQKKSAMVLWILASAFGYSQTQTFTTTGTYTVPAGVTSITVEAWGGGGKGGTVSIVGVTSGGGGGGAYTRKVLTVSPGNIFTATVGAGSTTTAAGGDSWFSTNSTVLSKGGNSVANNSATGAAGGLASACIGDISYNGGNGANGAGILGGGGGSSAGTASNGANASGSTAGSAPSGGGNGGNGNLLSLGGGGTAGSAPGGGGGGSFVAVFAQTGGSGGNGKIIVTWIVAPEINITGNSVSIADGAAIPTTTNGTDFGAVDVTSGTASQTFTIQNNGSAALTVGAITFSGTNASDFTLTSSPSSSIAIGGSSTFSVTFNPSAPGTRTANISIVNNDSDENPYNFALTGNGAVPEMNVIGNYITIVDGDTTPDPVDTTDFGSVSIGSGSVTVTYTIENTGGSTLNIGTITFSGTNAADFSLLSAPASTIAAGGSTSFQVDFNPTVLGVKTAIVSIASNDSDENPYNFTISGLGVQTYFDTDQDGITDNFDIDDDNDGIIDITEQTSCQVSPFASSVQYTFLNETFGTGTTKGLININIPGATCTYCFEDGIVGTNTVACPFQSSKILDDGEYCVNYKVTGTSISDPENIHGDLAWYDGQDHTAGDTNGRMAIFNASFAAGTFYETTITGVIPNVPITYSFWALNIMAQSTFSGSILPNITVEFTDLSNNVISTFNTGDLGRCSSNIADNSCTTGVWQQFTTTVNLGNVTDFIIRFKNNAPGGGGNDLALDDINIVQQYCDSDGDGVANLFDLDDENDGIPDIEEAGFKAYSNGTATMDTVIWLDANGNGLYDPIDSMISGGSYLIPDTDSDTVSDYLDLDSDNDSFFDIDEAGLLNGDGDVNGDGKGDLADTDHDGILDFHDNYTGFGTVARAYAQNTDGAGNPDYMQVDANNDGTKDITLGLFASLDTNSDGKIDGTVDIDKDGLLDSFDTNTSAIGSPRDLDRKLFLEFDGRNDYGQASSILGGLSAASIMAWIDLNSAFSGDGVIIGQDNFQLRITSAKKIEAVVNSTTVNYSALALNTAQWYHVGAVYGNGFLKLYLNGVMVASSAASGNIAADASSLTIGKNPGSAAKYFKGKIDEARVFDVALTDQQLQRMVYQEIQNNNAAVRGAIIPKDIGSLPYTNLLRYYRMDAYKDDIIDDLTTTGIDTGTGMKIYNNKYIYYQQAPMPFVTVQTGNFATAVNSSLKDVRGQDIMDQDWSIVQVHHDITETSNNIDLGMFIDAGVKITMNNDTKIQNDWYLSLDGKIDLQGLSQLVQTTNSDLAITSAGAIDRDQKGQSNIYNYNYWSSPVGSLSASSNNTSFTINGVMKDGTDPLNIQNINWTSGYNGSPTTPITLSSYWIYKFQNVSPVYANWSTVGQNGTLQAAQGFTMKGSGAATTNQNYTFTGKPNNGAISNPIAATYGNLSGNPYASALDADAFITANLASTTGILYFWEHFPTNTSHVLLEYQGGYATRSLVGGTPPASPDGISGAGSSNRIPGRYIPVGQGFLLFGNATGGTINFDNSQRAFIKEENVASNYLFRQQQPTNVKNAQDPSNEDNFARIRLSFTSAGGFSRQLLLGFMNELATNDYDTGYDALLLENYPDEMAFLVGDLKLVIQGVGHFDDTAIYPLSVKTSTHGNINISLESTENFEKNQTIYIYDNVTALYNDIRNTNFHIALLPGTYNDRFSLRFKNMTLGTNALVSKEVAGIQFTNSDNMIAIDNNDKNAIVKSVALINMLGQVIGSWEVKKEEGTKIKIPIKNISHGTYIVKVTTTKGDISKKIIIQ